MTVRLIHRVARMPAAEISFRLRGRVRAHADRWRVRALGSRWNRGDIAKVLARSIATRPLAKALDRRDWSTAEAELLAMLGARTPSFVLDPHEASSLSTEIADRWPDTAVRASAAADDILAGRYPLLGYRALSFSHATTDVDWHYDPVHERRMPRRFWADVPYLDPRYGDHKIIWELNRHQYFLTLGRALWLTRRDEYARAIIGHIRSWLRSNPPLIGVNWASALELGFRSLSWVTALHFLLARNGRAEPYALSASSDIGWLLDTFVAIDRQLTHVEQNLSQFFSPNTHLTGEALALYVVGTALPELASSDRWAAAGRGILMREASRQIHADGGHVELSTSYHRYTLEFYMLALLTAERAQDRVAVAVFGDAVTRLATFLNEIADAAGRVPLIGDDDGGSLWPIAGRDPADVRDALALAGVLTDRRELVRGELPEEVLWLAWSGRPAVRHQRGTTPPRPARLIARHFADSGYVVAHTPSGDHLTFDVGRHGFLNGGHAHADALAVTLNLGGRPLLIDSGTATYTMDAGIRQRMRESRSHNTLTLGGRSLAVPGGPFHWLSRATGRLDEWSSNPMFVVAEGSHDGYAPSAHRRAIIHGASTGWLVVDVVTAYTGTVEAYWHFHPDWSVHHDGQRMIGASLPTGPRAWLISSSGTTEVLRGDPDGAGWYSPRYGQLLPTSTARIHMETTEPLALVTWLGASESEALPRLDVLSGTADPSVTPIIVKTTHHGQTALTMLRPPGDSHTRDVSSGDLSTDARFLQRTLSDDARLDLSMVQATRVAMAVAMWPLVTIDSGETVADLHVTLRRGELDLWASRPPSRLTLGWGVGSQPSVVRLNGRDTVPAVAGVRQTAVQASDWGTARSRWALPHAAVTDASDALEPVEA